MALDNPEQVAAILTAIFLAPAFVLVFLKPRLRIVFEPDGVVGRDQFTPKRSFEVRSEGGARLGVVNRKHFKVIVRNVGFVTATGCRASVRLITARSGCSGTEFGWRPAHWQSGAPEVAIAKRGGEEVLDVAFSVGREGEGAMYFDHFRGGVCGVNQQPGGIAPWRGSFATPASLAEKVRVRPEDAFCDGVFDIEIRIQCSEGRHLCQRFSLSFGEDYRTATMEPARRL